MLLYRHSRLVCRKKINLQNLKVFCGQFDTIHKYWGPNWKLLLHKPDANQLRSERSAKSTEYRREGEKGKSKKMGIRFILMVNKQGQTRLAQYYEYLTLEERRALEGEIVRKCLARNEQQCSFVEHRNYKIVYRRYASLFFLVGVDNEENELAILEFIHLLVETMDRHFGNVVSFLQ
ncbi:AP-4 complex subunit sigma [Olea europaea subsp. europaea]|uniref:AP-4 complex subunit sigma n=1 Tax=Olea europaea subsp. europaea TaxID=158383 RepID=A0A8S0T4K5_OLEEU|nr:AP-4 complex subunit sigma [Olea europaea subsp. europaea]